MKKSKTKIQVFFTICYRRKGMGGRACENLCEKKFSLRNPLRKKIFPAKTPAKKRKKNPPFLNIKYLILQHKYLPHDLRDVW